MRRGFVDTFRHLHPNQEGQYTWWLQFMDARARNVGWRIDYFIAAEEVMPRITSAFILPEVFGSDHCPVGITLEIQD
jgi:exodeoxyribonuclease-3